MFPLEISNEATDLSLVIETWAAENTGDTSSMMMASSICALIFDYTSEESLLSHPDFNHSTLSRLYQLIARCLASSGQVNYKLLTSTYFILVLPFTPLLFVYFLRNPLYWNILPWLVMSQITSAPYISLSCT